MVEPWLRGTLLEVDAVRRQVLHALELAHEDAERWCTPLTDEQMNARPFGLAPVAFHLRHIARSLDRLLTYAEGAQLSPAQFDDLQSELAVDAATEVVMAELKRELECAMERVLRVSSGSYEEVRLVGRGKLPSTVGGLLVHCAEHTQRHIGQAITTAQFVQGMSNGAST